MSTAFVIDHRMVRPTFDVRSAQRMVLKYCEECRELFPCTKDEALAPGDYMALWRGAGHRPAVICDKCAALPFQRKLDPKEAATMLEIARHIRAQRDKFQATSPLREGTQQRARQKEVSTQKARRSWVNWRIPLAAALKERGELTGREVREITKLSSNVSLLPYIRRVMPAFYSIRSEYVGNAGLKTTFYGLLQPGQQIEEVKPVRDDAGHFVAVDLKGAHDELDRKLITQALEIHRWNRKRAAHTLGISYRQMIYKIRELKLTPPTVAPAFTNEFIEQKFAEFRATQH